jgi:lysyl-tRNA synthetase class II
MSDLSDEYRARKEKIIKVDRWFSPSLYKDRIDNFFRGRILKMQRLSGGRGVQLLLFTYFENISIFFSSMNPHYNDFLELVKIGDIIVVDVAKDKKGYYAVNFMVVALCVINTEDLNYFNHNIEKYSGDALHKRITGSRSEVESYKTMSIVLESLHDVMRKDGFLQVFTPTIERHYRGGYARPFVTYSNYLRKDVYLRITAEIYHKQLIIGGIERLYELVLSFRNEAESQTSRTAFNLVEVEAAYVNENIMFDLLLRFLRLAGQCAGIDIPEYESVDTVEKMLFNETKKTFDNIHELVQTEPYSNLGVEAFTLDGYRLANLIFRRFIIPSCKGLKIIQDLQQNYSPFVEKDKNEVFRWFVIWNGYKIAEIYRSETDVNLIKQGLKDICEKTGRSLTIYENYLHSQFCGMPPIATMSIGIERIIMLMCKKNNLHNVFE